MKDLLYPNNLFVLHILSLYCCNSSSILMYSSDLAWHMPTYSYQIGGWIKAYGAKGQGIGQPTSTCIGSLTSSALVPILLPSCLRRRHRYDDDDNDYADIVCSKKGRYVCNLHELLLAVLHSVYYLLLWVARLQWQCQLLEALRAPMNRKRWGLCVKVI